MDIFWGDRPYAYIESRLYTYPGLLGHVQFPSHALSDAGGRRGREILSATPDDHFGTPVPVILCKAPLVVGGRQGRGIHRALSELSLMTTSLSSAASPAETQHQVHRACNILASCNHNVRTCMIVGIATLALVGGPTGRHSASGTPNM